MQRRRIAQLGCLGVAALLLVGASCGDRQLRSDPVGCSPHYVPAGPIELEWPRRMQVVQHEDGLGEIRVRGRLVGVEPGALLLRYRGGAWLRVDADAATGAFEAALPGQPIGWGALEVELERDPNVSTRVAPVGVGNVVALAGQSNMVMRLATRSFTRRGATVLGTRRHPLDPHAIEWADDPIHDCADSTGSIWPTFADRLIRGGGAPVMLVAAAVGGTGLVASGEWLPGGRRFLALLEQLRVATAGRMCVSALLWLQGEYDALVGVSREDYRDGLVALADAIAAATSCEVPIVAGRIGRIEAEPYVAPAAAEAIRAGTLDAIDASPHLHPGPATDDLPIAQLHFTDAAAGALLERWCAAVAAAPTGLVCAP